MGLSYGLMSILLILQSQSTWGLHTLWISHEDHSKHFQKEKQNFSYSLHVQKQDETLREVSFSPQKYSELKTLGKNQESCEVAELYISASNDIIIHQKSRLSPLDNIPFAMSGEITANGVTSISALTNVMPEQIINLKAQVTHVSSV